MDQMSKEKHQSLCTLAPFLPTLSASEETHPKQVYFN